MAFLSRTTCNELVRELGRNTPITANELMDIVTNYATGEEAVSAIFGRDRDKGKPKDEEPEGSNRGAKRSNRKKKKNQQGKCEATAGDLAATTNRKKPRGPPGGGIFEKMLKEPCPYHKGPTNHNLEDCHMLRRYFESLGIKKDDKKEDPKKRNDNKDKGFPEIHDCFMIYGGPSTHLSARQRKREHREVFSMQLATPLFLDWSNVAITFDRDDHPDYVPNPGVYPLVIDPIIANTRLTKVLMDSGSSLNIICAQTLDLLGVKRTHLRPSVGGFHGVILGKRPEPVGRIDLPVCFGTPSNFRKETLTFKVVGFQGTYHAILGCPCYAKFMAVPNYTYLKLKMLGPKGVITIGPSYEHAYECNVECVEHEDAVLESATLAADLDGLAKEIPDPKRHTGNFEPAEDVKLVPLDPDSSDGRTLKVSTTLDPK
jgi:hypothetical protein